MATVKYRFIPYIWWIRKMPGCQYTRQSVILPVVPE
jgi:hypothetical protein